jgi:hypothetical protein
VTGVGQRREALSSRETQRLQRGCGRQTAGALRTTPISGEIGHKKCLTALGVGAHDPIHFFVHRAMPSKRKRWRNAAVAALVGCGVVGLALAGLRSALQRVPDFYAEAVAMPAAAEEAAGETLERRVLALHNEVRDAGHWSAVFTDEQINGWLAADLPEKFPQLLPPEIEDPRIVFAPGQLQLAFRYTGSQLTTIVSLTLEVRLAEEPNTLAVRVRGARAGLVPLPLRQFLDHVTESVRRADLLLRWAQSDGDPVALVTFAESRPHDDDAQPLLERIEIRAGEIHLAGRTVPPDDPSASPSTAGQHR